MIPFFTPASLLIASLLGTLISAFAAVIFPKKIGFRISNILLCVSALIGLLVGSQIALNATSTINISTPFWFGMQLELDHLGSLFFVLLSAVVAVVAIYAIPYGERYKDTYNLPLLAAGTAIFVFGMQAVILATNSFGFLFAWEIMSISSFFLVIADGSKASLKAGILYLVMTHIGAGALAAGLFLLSGGAIFNDFASIAASISTQPAWMIATAFGLLFFGFGSKAGIFPFHVWLPEAHPQAPSHISALMSGVMLKIAIYGFMRILMTVLLPVLGPWYAIPMIVLGAASAMLGALYAVLEKDIKRVLAYSSIENIGLIVLMLGVFVFAITSDNPTLGVTAFSATVIMIYAHALFKSGLFLAAGTIIAQVHERSMEAMGGLARRMPALSVFVFVLALCASALPLSGAFAAELIFVQGLLTNLGSLNAIQALIALLIIAVIAFAGGLAAFAMLKLFAIVFLGAPRGEHAKHAATPGRLLSGGVGLLAVCSIIFGLAGPSFISRLVEPRNPLEGIPPLVGVLLGRDDSASGLWPFNPWPFAALLSLIILGLFLLRRLFSDSKRERVYQTWDCGQPINAGMEYTGAAFSAPIRFFFRFLLRTKKSITSVPVVAGNPLSIKHSFTLDLRSVIYDLAYRPTELAIKEVARRVRSVQSGNIHGYIALMIATLVITLVIAL